MTRNGGRERLWTKELGFAWVTNFFLSFGFYLLITTMALYAVERFGASDTGGGLAASIFIIGATVARLFAGNLVDLVGRRRVLLLSLVVFLVASLSYLPVDALDSFGMLLAVRAVHGVAFGMASTAALAFAQAIIPMSRRAEGTGYFMLSTTLATAIGPALALLLVHGPGYRALFIATGVAGVLAMVVALFLRSSGTPLHPHERARLRRFHPRDMLHRDVIPVASFMFVLAIGYSGVLAFVNSYAGERDLEAGVSVFFLVYAAVLLLTRFVAGPLQDRRGDNLVVYLAVIAFAAGLVVLAAATSNAVLLLAGGLMGLGFGTLMSALQAIAVGRVPMRRVGVAVSTHFFMLDLGVGIGPVVLGVLLNRVALDEMYLILAGVVLLSTILYHLVHGRVDKRRRSAVPVDVRAR